MRTLLLILQKWKRILGEIMNAKHTKKLDSSRNEQIPRTQIVVIISE